jgi:hypothetical protein
MHTINPKLHQNFPIVGLLLTFGATITFGLLLFTTNNAAALDPSIFSGLVAGTALALSEFILLRVLPAKPQGILSNIYGLTIIAGITILCSLVNFNQFWLAILAGLTLSLNAALWGDLFSTGNYDNWLWVLKESQILALRRRFKSHLLAVVTLYFVWITGAYVLVFFALRAQSLNQSFPPFLDLSAILRIPVLGQVSLIILLVIVFWLTANMLVTFRKHTLLTSNSVLPRYKSIQLLLGKLSGAKPSHSLNYLVKQMQRDQFAWILCLAGIISLCEITIFLAFPQRGQLFSLLFFVVPFAIALFYGSVGHTTSSEMGGVFGVLISALIAWIIALIFPDYRWDPGLFFLIFLSALASWAIGLFSGIFSKGIQRMSLLTFALEYEWPSRSITPILINMIKIGIERGYDKAAKRCFGEFAQPTQAVVKIGSAISTGESIVLGDEQIHLSINFKQRPFLQQLFYALCANRLDHAGRSPYENVMMPVFPETYFHIGYSPTTALDIQSRFPTGYTVTFWGRNKHEVLPSFLSTSPLISGYQMTPGSVVDHGLTLGVNILTDLFIVNDGQHKEGGQKPSFWIIGFCRGRTSTKSYVTLEGEIFASHLISNVQDELKAMNARIIKEERARLYYPQLSIYDYGYDPDGKQEAGKQFNSADDQLSPLARAYIQQLIKEIPERDSLTTLTQNYKKNIILWFVEVAAATILAGGKITQTSLIDFIKSFLKML